MAYQYFPIPKNVPDMTMVVTFDQAEYELRIRWNMRAGWFIDVADGQRQPIITGRAMVLGTDIFASVRYDERVPLGRLFLVDTTRQDIEPGFLDLASGPTLSDLEGRVMLVYGSE